MKNIIKMKQMMDDGSTLELEVPSGDYQGLYHCFFRGLEQGKIIEEFKELLVRIADLSDILARPERLTQVIRAGYSLLDLITYFTAGPNEENDGLFGYLRAE